MSKSETTIEALKEDFSIYGEFDKEFFDDIVDLKWYDYEIMHFLLTNLDFKIDEEFISYNRLIDFTEHFPDLTEMTITGFVLYLNRNQDYPFLEDYEDEPDECERILFQIKADTKFYLKYHSEIERHENLVEGTVLLRSLRCDLLKLRSKITKSARSVNN